MTPRVTLIAVLTVGASAAALGACTAAGFSAEDTSTILNFGAIDAGDGGEAATDAGPEAQAAPLVEGSPLCNAVPSSCDPDRPTTAKACGLAPDGGAYNSSAGYDNAVLACRVVSTSPSATDGDQQPACTPAGSAGDSSWCESSSECQAAFECVGSGTCQHYCCSGNAECVADQFCDIQPTTQASGVEVPVCMPIHPASGCTLLDPTACPATETCAVVRDDGSTSCVAIGGAKAKEQCDTQHCAANLVCLGTPGSRTCFQLCLTATAEGCSANQQCQGGLPLFPDPTYGICQ